MKFFKKKTLSKPSKKDYELAKLTLNYLQTNLDYSQIKELLLLEQTNLSDYLKKFYHRNENQYESLTSVFSYQQTLRYTIDQWEFDTLLNHQLKAQFAYPLILYIIMYCLLGFFSLFLVPTLLSMISMFDLDTTAVEIGKTLLKVIFFIFTCINSLLLILMVHFSNKQNLKLFISKYHNKKFFTLFKKIITHKFAKLYSILVNYGLSTKQSLEIMKSGSTSYLLSWISLLITYQLEEGKGFVTSFSDNFLDLHFNQILSLASKNNQLITLLDSYLVSNLHTITMYITNVSKTIKIVIYIVLGLLIIFLYQILLTPMNLMSTL